METNWYEVNTHSEKLDLSDNSLPNAYFTNQDHANIYSKLWSPYVEITSVENPPHLEYLISDENDKLKASFKFESHALRYNIDFLNGKGSITPNSKE